ncbi:MAG: NUDIX domain-containing protein [Mesobacillus sp.]
MYGIILKKEENLVALIDTGAGKYFLPGGGIEENESHEECLIREGKEEMGKLLELGEWIGKAQQYFYSKKDSAYYQVQGDFYFAKIVGDTEEPTEPDHYLRWLETGEAVSKIFHDHQRWALQKALAMIENKEQRI